MRALPFDGWRFGQVFDLHSHDAYFGSSIRSCTVGRSQTVVST
jgi:hypothetical protein